MLVVQAMVCPHCDRLHQAVDFDKHHNRCCACHKAERALLTYWQRRGLGVQSRKPQRRQGLIDLFAAHDHRNLSDHPAITSAARKRDTGPRQFG